jgi:lipopolysaccharide biosynthesis glycosyltransferase
MNSIDVVVAADANFAMQLATTLTSLSAHGGGGAHRVFVLHDGYSTTLRGRVVEGLAETIDVVWIDARSNAYGGTRMPDYLPEASLFRLRLTEILPEDVTRVLFLDTDIVVREPLGGLWETDLGGAVLGAVRDAVYPWAGSQQCLDWRALGVPPDMPYFNAGVMLIPLDEWRSNRVGERALDLLRGRTLRYGDQCALNVVAGGQWHTLPPRWNLQTGHLGSESPAWICESAGSMEDALDQPAVVHFTTFLGIDKPWIERSGHPRRDEWFTALDATAWSGWRPDDAPPSLLRESVRRTRRAGGVLLRGA